MADDKIILQNLRSADVLSGSSADLDVAKHFDGANSPKLPESNELEFGEIALNIATGYEVIAIKNYDGNIVYLPFNLAERVLNQQASIDEFKDEIITDFNTLSALTQTQLNKFLLDNEKLAVKITSLSGSIESVSSVMDEKINSVSAETDSKISGTTEQLKEYIAVEDRKINETIVGVSGSIDSKIEGLDTKVDTLSGNVYSKIENTKRELQSEISAITSGGSSSVAELERKLNTFSGEVETSIGTIKLDVRQQKDYTDRRLNDLSASTKAYADSLNTTTNSRIDSVISGFNDSVNSALSGSTTLKAITTSIRNEIQSGDTSLNNKLIAIRNSLGFDAEGKYHPRESELSGMTVSRAIDYLNQSINDIEIHYPGHEELAKIKDSVLTLSAETIAEFDIVENTVEELSGVVISGFSGISDSINRIVSDSKEAYSALTTSVQSLSGDVILLSATTLNKINTLSAQTDSKVDNLVAYIDGKANVAVDSAVGRSNRYTDQEITSVNETISGETSRIDEKIDNFSSETISRIDINEENIQSNAESISGLTVDVEEIRYVSREALSGAVYAINVLGDKIDELSGETDAKVEQVASDTEKALTNLDNKISQKISGTAESVLTTSRQYTDNKVQTEIASSSATTLYNANQYTDEKSQEIISGTSKIIGELIASTDNKISNIKLGDLKDVNIGSIEQSDGDIEIISRSTSGWSNTTIGYATQDKVGLVKPGSGLTVDNGVIKPQIDDTVTSGSDHAVSSKAVYNAVSAVSAHVDDVEEKYKDVADKFEDLKETVITVSGETDQKFESFSASVETHLTESDLVQAATLAKQNFELGFNENAEFQPESEPLQGRSVTEAIDYIYYKAESVSGKCMTKYDTLYGIIEDDELTTAGAVSKINHYLGFNANAQYVPESEGLELMNVTEAIDYINDKVMGVEGYIDSEQAMHMMRSVTYEKLLQLKQDGLLRWGMLYRITNYQATVSDAASGYATTRMEVVESDTNTNNGFDILVRATSNSTINENAVLMQSQLGKASLYFEDCNVSSWAIKYSIENDTSRFDWANTNGFGVIYYMRDNYGNEAPYDFKNILLIPNGGTSGRFTFGNRIPNQTGITYEDFSNLGYARNNVIKPTYNENTIQTLNRIIFEIDTKAIGNEFAAGCHDMVLQGDFVDNKISHSKSSTNITAGEHGPMQHVLLGYEVM